jgi:trigger factor
MQVSVETVGDLERKLTIQVPPERIEGEVDNRLKSLARKVKLDGFRPGKVPFKEVKRRYDGQVRSEVIGDVIDKSLQEAIAQENLQPAGGPKVEPVSMNPGEALEYTATFEVYPEVELVSLANESVERIQAEISDADVEKTLEKLQTQRVTWNAVEREAQEGDQVTLNFEGFIDGEAFEGGKGESVPVVLGSGSMIPGFEDQLTGIKAGESRTLEVTFPETYAAKELAGKAATFEAAATEVAEPVLPEINDEFAVSLGINEGTVDALRAEVRDNMQRELDNRVRSDLKQKVLDVLVKANDITLPRALIDEEIKLLMQQAQQQMGGNSNFNLPPAVFEDKARERVAMGLLMGEVIKKNDIAADDEGVNEKLREITETYEDQEQTIEQYRKNPQLMRNVAGLVLEDKVLEQLLNELKVNEVQQSFDEVMNADDTAGTQS